MARPLKLGLDYFPLDVNFFSDTKISRLRAKFGNNAVMVYLNLLCRIYEHGFYIDYDEDLILDISDTLNITENYTRQVIEHLLSRSMLDSKLAVSVKILTAASIQRRYQEIKKRSKSVVKVYEPYWLLKKSETVRSIQLYLNDDNSENNDSFSAKNSFNSEKNDTKERKGKESKGKEIKGKEKKGKCYSSPSNSKSFQQIVENFNSICSYLPKVETMSRKREEAIGLCVDRFGIDTMNRVFEKANNSKFLTGTNDWNWRATFDWLIKPSNFVKVLEGNYDEKKGKKEEYSFDLDKYTEMINNFGE